MSKKPGAQAAGQDDGLKRLVENAPSFVMRELAGAATWRRLSLGQIATRISKKDATVDPSNVRRYFEAQHPRPTTIDALRRAIGVTERHAKLASGVTLSEREYRQIDASLRLVLARREAEFEDGAVPEALGALESLDADQQKAVLGNFELQQQRITGRMVVPLEREDFGPSDELVAFATALRHYTSFDLLKRLRHQIAGENTLWSLWVNLTSPAFGAFTERDAEALIHHASGLLRARGIDTRPMEEHLNRQRAALRRADLAARRLKEET